MSNAKSKALKRKSSPLDVVAKHYVRHPEKGMRILQKQHGMGYDEAGKFMSDNSARAYPNRRK